MDGDSIDVLLTGDLILDAPDPCHWLSGIAPTLQGCDLAVGHLEVPHTSVAFEAIGDVPAPPAPPENIAAIARAGIGMVSLAGNHVADCGAEGISETIALLAECGVAHAGAGSDIDRARMPAICDVSGTKIALLSYNCVGPEFAWAGEASAGCAYLALETLDGAPISPTARIVCMSPLAREVLAADIASARLSADVVIVALHQGKVHTPICIEAYELETAYAAVDCGANAVVAHHAHILRGISFRNGVPIFHGLGNGCVVTSALSPGQDHAARGEWVQRRREMFGFEPDPAYNLAPFHPEATNAFLGRLRIDASGRVEAGIVPVHVEAPGRPVVADPERAALISRYVERITIEAGLPAIQIAADGRVGQLT